jgi:hypothetical protein
MRTIRSAFLLSSLAAGVALFPTGSASGLPLSPGAGGAELATRLDAVLPTTEVRYRRGRRYNSCAAAAGIIGGAILGGIIASQSPRYYDPYGPYSPVYRPIRREMRLSRIAGADSSHTIRIA